VLDDQSRGQHFFGQRGTLQQWKDEVSGLCRNIHCSFSLSAPASPQFFCPQRAGWAVGFILRPIVVQENHCAESRRFGLGWGWEAWFRTEFERYSKRRRK
jgi:hypothetical protein